MTAVAAAGVITLVVVRGRLLVPLWVILAMAIPWAAFSVFLRLRRRGLGREGRYLDWWSIPHTLVGVLFALLRIEGVIVAAIAIAWELIEIGTRVQEHPANRVIDVVLAVAGWTATTAAFGFAVPFL